jgi:DNA-binding transcriptional LysR family regulator
MATNWDDLRVFLTLAREGNLTAAAKRLNVSHPTVARRTKALEVAIGARLFDRLPDRYVLTPAGEELLADAQSMEQASDSLDRRIAGLTDTARGTVRISAGEAMTAFLARNVAALRRNLQGIEFELGASHMLANLSRREADLMIREQIPDLASIVARKLGSAAYAVYASATFQIENTGRDTLRRQAWVGFDEDHDYMPGQAWVRDLIGGAWPSVRVNNWLVLQEAVRSGAGLAVMPCYVGDGDHHLRRIGPILKDVAAEQYLLVHRDLRELPRVRAVMDALIALFQRERAALDGKRPTRMMAA